MAKFNKVQRELIKTIVNLYSLKRLSNDEIIHKIYEETKQTVTPAYISQVRKSNRKEAAAWFRKIREGEHEYIFQFKQRVDEIIWLQQQHYNLISKALKEHNNSIVLSALAELHKLNVTLSNYYDVAPVIDVFVKRQIEREEET